MDKLKKVAITVALFVAVWALAAFLFGTILFVADWTDMEWYETAISFGLGVGAVTVYDRMKEW